MLNEFKKGSTAILVATDVAARSVGVYFAQSFTIIISWSISFTTTIKCEPLTSKTLYVPTQFAFSILTTFSYIRTTLETYLKLQRAWRWWCQVCHQLRLPQQQWGLHSQVWRSYDRSKFRLWKANTRQTSFGMGWLKNFGFWIGCSVLWSRNISSEQKANNKDLKWKTNKKLLRIGRTGRKGNSGTAYTLFTRSNAAKVTTITTIIHCSITIIIPSTT